ncbi:MAG: hypothetical protein P8099_19015 [Gemmatimonadota bacterium]
MLSKILPFAEASPHAASGRAHVWVGGTEVDWGNTAGNVAYEAFKFIPWIGSGLEVGEMIDSCAVF